MPLTRIHPSAVVTLVTASYSVVILSSSLKLPGQNLLPLNLPILYHTYICYVNPPNPNYFHLSNHCKLTTYSHHAKINENNFKINNKINHAFLSLSSALQHHQKSHFADFYQLNKSIQHNDLEHLSTHNQKSNKLTTTAKNTKIASRAPDNIAVDLFRCAYAC